VQARGTSKKQKRRKIMIAKINGLDWVITVVPDDNPEIESEDKYIFGSTNIFKQVISINEKIQPTSLMPTLLHELTHAALFSYGLDSHDTFTKEEMCDFFGAHGKEIVDIAKRFLKSYNIMDFAYFTVSDGEVEGDE
jgi:hypothetical protein